MTFWRKWHRWLGTIAGVLLVLIGATGALLQIDEVTHFTDGPRPAPVDPARLAPIDPVALATRIQSLSGERQILSLQMEARQNGPAAIVRFVGAKSPVELNLETGAQQASTDPAKPKNTRLRRIQLLVLNFHTFGLVGPWGHVVGIFASFMLIGLSGSGLWMWWTMLRERTRRSKTSWFWR
ncbi:MAG: PepSY-associated TM helix domain-containing protein [Sphingobium sp.]